MKESIIAILIFCLFPSYKPVGADANTIFLPPGVTIVKTPIILKSGQSLIGDNSTLYLESGANCPVVIAGSDEDFPTVSRDIFIYGIEIDGNKQNQEFEIEKRGHIRNNGISVRNADNVIISNVSVRNCRSGGLVLERGSRRVSVLNSVFSENYFDGIAGYESEGCLLYNLQSTQNEAAGISLDLNFNKNTIVSTSINGNKKEGIFMRHSNYNRFSNLSISGNGGDSVFIALSELPGSAAKFNVFSDIYFFLNKGDFKINDSDCVGNKLIRPIFSDDGLVVKF
jgi:hypothetical protein